MPLKLKDETVKLLRNVRHVRFPNDNLISLEMLDAIRCENRDILLKLFKTLIKVILVGEKINDLLFVGGVETVTRAYTVTTNEITEVDT